jgi:hypothetical protein
LFTDILKKNNTERKKVNNNFYSFWGCAVFLAQTDTWMRDGGRYARHLTI